MGPVTLFTDIFSKLTLNPIQYPGRCLRKRLNTNQCQRCVNSCPSGAVTLNDREIELNKEKCTGCMSCTATCPQDAFESEYDLNELIQACKGGSNIVISCARQKQTGPDEIVLPCVGILSKHVLPAIFIINSKSLVINLSGCAGCCNQVVSDSFVNNYKEITEGLAKIRTAKTILIHNEEQLRDVIVDRRLYLANIGKFATRLTKKRFAINKGTQPDKKETTRRIPLKVRLLKDVVAELETHSRIRFLELFSKQLSINDNCTLCPLCKGICPTGAIQIERSEGCKKLKFNPLDCSGCGLCVEFCKKNALSIY